jgi:hypothetical protein
MPRGDNAGRKPHNPTDEIREKVRKMSGFGVPQPMIAGVFDICENTLKKHYAQELAVGKGLACAQIGQRLYQRAFEDGDVTALIWYTKTQMGWTDKTQVDHTSSDGSMTPVVNVRFDEN